MKVILVKDVQRVGQKYDVKEVKDGYALNFLIPRGLAEKATPQKIQKIESERTAASAEQEAQSDAIATALKNLKETTIEIKANANEQGGLFESLKASDIAKAISDKGGVEIPESLIQLEDPIKQTGNHTISVGNISISIIIHGK